MGRLRERKDRIAVEDLNHGHITLAEFREYAPGGAAVWMSGALLDNARQCRRVAETLLEFADRLEAEK